MKDSISRKAAIHAVCAFAIYRYEASQEELEAIQAVLNALPDAQSERIRARWDKKVLGWQCSNCHIFTNDFGAREFIFCPNCGADMRGTWEVEHD